MRGPTDGSRSAGHTASPAHPERWRRGPGQAGDLGADVRSRGAVVLSGRRRTADEERPDPARIGTRSGGTDPGGGRERHVRHGDRVGRRHSQADPCGGHAGRPPRIPDHGRPLFGGLRLDRSRGRRCGGQRPRRGDRTGLQRDPPVGVQFRARPTCSPRWSATCRAGSRCSTRPPAPSRSRPPSRRPTIFAR